MKPTQAPSAATSLQALDLASERAANSATPKSEGRAQPTMRYVAVGSAPPPPPSPPPKLLLTFRSEPKFELMPGPDFMRLVEDRSICRRNLAGSVPPPPPPPPEEPPPPPQQATRDPRWPPENVVRVRGEEPEPPEMPEQASDDMPPQKAAPPPGSPPPARLADLRQAGQPGPPVDWTESWLPPMPGIPQPFTLPPQMKDFFRSTPEPALLRALQMLLSQGLDAGAKDEMGNSLLMLACATGKPAVVRFLIERCPSWASPLLNRFGENAATLAQAYCPEALSSLLEAGVELYPENPALQWYLSQPAGTTNDASRLQQLAAILGQDNYLNLRDETGKTLLFHAVIRADVDVVRFLCNLAVGPAVVWRDAIGKSLFGYTTEIADVRLGAAICKELRALRGRERPLYRRTVERF